METWEARAIHDRVIFARWITSGVALGLVLSAGLMWGCPIYNVWERGLKGESELKQATWNRQIKVQEAQASEEAAKHLAQVDILRAEGVAKANQIIGSSLKQNEVYLSWLWIESLKEGKNQVIYVPTEAQIPILEAQRFQFGKPEKGP